MRTYLKTGVIVVVVMLIFSCSKEDNNDAANAGSTVACFTYTINGSTVTFNSSCSKNANEYLWDFGNNQTSIAANPVYKFYSSGTHQVTLQVTSSSGNSNAITKSVELSEKCMTCSCIDHEPPGFIIWENTFCGTEEQVQTWRSNLPSCNYSLECY